MTRKRSGQGIIEYALLMLIVMTILTGLYKGTLFTSSQDKYLERIAVAQESQAKSLESINRWVWTPEAHDVCSMNPHGLNRD